MGIWRPGLALLADGGIVQEVVRVAVTAAHSCYDKTCIFNKNK